MVGFCMRVQLCGVHGVSMAWSVARVKDTKVHKFSFGQKW
jgi:hypothetical protein